MQVKFVSLLLVVLLVVACVNPVAAMNPHEDADEGGGEFVGDADDQISQSRRPIMEGDLAVIVWGDDGDLYALTTLADNPDPWFKTIKPYDTIKLLRDGDGNVIYTADDRVTALFTIPADAQSSSWPLPGAIAQNPTVVTGIPVGIVAVYLVPGVGEVALVATGAVVIGGTLYYVATSNDPISVNIRNSFKTGTAQFIQKGTDRAGLLPQYMNGVVTDPTDIAHVSRLFTTLNQLEHDYNDAKNKGKPTKNNKDQTGHGIENNADYIRPYMSVSLFHNKIDKDNGCPKQIRYYGKDGKAELDIDFGHDANHPFPHKHTWEMGKRSKWFADAKLEELFKTNPCKKYLEQKYGKNPPQDLEDL